MPRTVLTDNKGLTLVEVTIALLVLLLVMLALMQTAIVSIDANMLNVLRDNAVNIAEEEMKDVRNDDFDDVASKAAAPVLRNIRNISNFAYTVTTTVTNINLDTRQIVVTVSWDWKERTAANGDPYTHTISSILSRPTT
ncbi:MAG: prepilin-type N-terminal cleavage/methylation domain-containing protein [Nitrospirota bacterium]